MEYTGKYLEFEGKSYPVIDTSKLDFSEAKVGVKAKLTRVYCAKGGEKIETTNDKGEVESFVVAQKGDAIFWNSKTDIYIPADKNGNHWKFADIESYGYSIKERNLEEGYIMIRSNNKGLLLVGCVKENCAIENAFGEGSHQFLYPGATIKKDIKTGSISGIDKDAFEKTWAVLPEEREEF